MDLIREDTVAALHRAMVVLREELEMKNKTISRLRRRRRHQQTPSNPAKSLRCFVSIEDLPQSGKTCLGSARRILEVKDIIQTK